MRDCSLDEQCEQAEAFAQGWRKFRETWPTLQSAVPIRQQDEQEFRHRQSQLVEQWELLRTGEGDEAEALGVLRRTVSLRVLQELSREETERLEKDWHAVLIGAEARVERLKARRAELAAISAAGFWAKKVLRQPLVIVALMLLLVAVAFYLITMLQWLPRR